LRDESELHGAGDIIVFMGGERRSDKPGERYGMHAAKRGEILPDFGRKASSGAGFHGQSLVTWPMKVSTILFALHTNAIGVASTAQ
jgi:hypothetical protein